MAVSKHVLSRPAPSQRPPLSGRQQARETLDLTHLSVLTGFWLIVLFVILARHIWVTSFEIPPTSPPTPTMTLLKNWETISSDDKGQSSEYSKTDIYMGSSDVGLSQAYQGAEHHDNMFPHLPNQPPRLIIIGATWGGVSVTDDIRAMVASDDRVTLDMYNLYNVLTPDPAYGAVKTLTVLYQREGLNNNGEMHLLNIPEHTAVVSIWADKHALAEQEAVDRTSDFVQTIHRPWRTGLPYNGSVEILAALYGPERIETPWVLQELAKFFEGRRGQIRMTNAFWKKDTWPGVRKSWTVYFRFTDSKRIQVVTGMEDGALEVPWGRF
ncbi:hypothetical protein GE21DRAFT_1284063 [Neurospora crassa]|nr:hypothetical protein GE21DRAFT_1284063 [Neurospora crassa]